MTQDPGPMVRRRQLGSALRRYRIDANKSIKEVAAYLMCSEAKVSRIETAQRNATPRDVRDLSEFYGLSDDVREALMSLAYGSREKGWWEEATIDPALKTMIGMEGSAKTISEFEGLLMPGLLQTRDYANAILGVWPPTDPAGREAAVNIRMRRQEILKSESPPTLNVVLDEAAIRRIVGSPQIMHHQLARLLQAIDSGANLQILPFLAGVHLGMTNGFTVLEFPQAAGLGVDEQPLAAVVYAETLTGGAYLETPYEVERHLDAFGKLSNQALSVTESAGLVRATMHALH